MSLVPDQGAVKRFVAAGLYPPFGDRVHSGHLDAAEDDLDAGVGVGEDDVEQMRELAVSVADQKPGTATRSLEIHDEVANGLGHPGYLDGTAVHEGVGQRCGARSRRSRASTIDSPPD